jgi:hypothetical protein
MPLAATIKGVLLLLRAAVNFAASWLFDCIKSSSRPSCWCRPACCCSLTAHSQQYTQQQQEEDN